MIPSTCIDHLDDIQAHIIRSARPAAARYYFLRIQQADAFVRWLQQPLLQSYLLSEREIRALLEGHRPRPNLRMFINLAFTWNGLKTLGLPQAILEQFPPAFVEGMAARAQFLGDYGCDAPEHWQGYYGSPHLHVLVSLNFIPWMATEFRIPDHWPEADIQAHDQYLQNQWAQLWESGPSTGFGHPSGAEILMQESAHVIRENEQLKEHFGYADGVSQPWLKDGRDMRREGGGGKKITDDGPWMPLATGEFLLGYQDELYQRNHKPTPDGNEWLPDAKDPTQASFQRLTRNGSYLVYRKLEQDVAAYRALTKNDDTLAAQLVGRKHDGTPLTSRPAESMNNAFDFGDDRKGNACPFASHMRRANPRLTLSEGKNEGTLRVDQHRLIRRGLPYGPYIPLDADAARAIANARGLHFFCYNSRIDSQFEFVQKNWLNQCDFMGFPANMVDPIAGNRARDLLGQFSFNSSEMPRFGLKQYVQVKGGEYFFSPGLKGLGLLLSLRQTFDPFWQPKQRIDTFDPKNSDPFDVKRHVDAAQLVTGKRFVKLWVEQHGGVRVPFYYFAHHQDLDSILNQPNLFTNVQYRQRIMALTKGDMLLSQPESVRREEQKKLTRKLITPASFEQRMQDALQPALRDIRARFLEQGQLDLVEGLARQLPLAIVKNFFGIAPPQAAADGIFSRAQIAAFFDRTNFSDMPDDWQNHADKYGFTTQPDDTLLFWIRMLFLQVFGNVYNVQHIAELAQAAAGEFLPQLDAQIAQAVSGITESGAATSSTVLAQLIHLYQTEYHYTGKQLILATRQSVLELAVGSTDTTAKAIATVVKTLLQFGEDLPSALMAFFIVTGNKEALKTVQQWMQKPETVPAEQINALLDTVSVLCLCQNPVAPLLPRYCPNGATYTTSAAEILNIEAGAVVCLVPQITLGVELQKLLNKDIDIQQKAFPFPRDKYLFMADTTHACMGRQIALLEIREALKCLLSLPAVRPAAGTAGIMQEKFRMPASMLLRCG